MKDSKLNMKDSKLKKPNRKLTFIALLCAATLLILFGLIKLADWRIGKQYTQFVNLDADVSVRTIRMLDLYPYDGFHVQAYTRHAGPMRWEQTTAFNGADVATGDKGYFIDFQLDNPPPKLTNEFRIVLFGGSGAQGWGATSNERMFYSVLQKELSGFFPTLKIRVINMAMGSTTAYQNFISLNKFGHKLQPDLMLGYVGRNDYIVPLNEKGTDWYCYSSDIQAFTMAARGYDCPPSLHWFRSLMPNTLRKTSVGVGLKLAYGMEYYRQQARDNYQRSTGITQKDTQSTLEKVAIPQLILALQSIKRDFDGVPMLIAWQPISRELIQPDRPAGDFYNLMFNAVVNGTQNCVNRKWWYLNIHQIGLTNTPAGYPVPNVLETHLNDQTHEVVGKLLAQVITEVIPKLNQ